MKGEGYFTLYNYISILSEICQLLKTLLFKVVKKKSKI